MYGALTYGQTPYGGLDSFYSGAFVSVSIDLSVSASAAHGIGGSAAIVIPDITVTIGADQVPRECTIVVEAGILVSLSSTIPAYAVGLIAPTASVSVDGSTTVSGVGAIQVLTRAVAYASHPLPSLVSIVAPVRAAIIATTTAGGSAAIYTQVAVSVDGLVVTHARAAITVPAYVSAAAKEGFIGTVSPTIQAVFSATASHAKASFAAINVPVTVGSELGYGCSIAGSATIPVYFSALSGAYQNIQIGAAIEVPLYTYMRCVFGEDLAYADCAYVLTKQNSVSVLQ